MGYAVGWASEAEDDIDRIASKHPVSASQILDQIDTLAADPVSISRHSSFPHPDFQKYQFFVPTENGQLWVTVLFLYLPDEATIEVQGIGVVEL